MSYVSVATDVVAGVAGDVAGIGSALDQAHSAAAPATTSVLAAAEDEVSAAIAAVFSGHGQAFQAASAQAAGFHNQFVQALGNTGTAYAAADTSFVQLLKTLFPNASFPLLEGIKVVPSSTPVDPSQFAGTYYEQGSVKQFFSLGLVNTRATYTALPNGTIQVQNFGNYFAPRGLGLSILGTAVPTNALNTALHVSFGPFDPAPTSTNYTIIAHAPDYNWVLVSDPTGFTGYVLTRDQFIPPQEYWQLVGESRSLGVWGPILPTQQYAQPLIFPHLG